MYVGRGRRKRVKRGREVKGRLKKERIGYGNRAKTEKWREVREQGGDGIELSMVVVQF